MTKGLKKSAVAVKWKNKSVLVFKEGLRKTEGNEYFG